MSRRSKSVCVSAILRIAIIATAFVPLFLVLLAPFAFAEEKGGGYGAYPSAQSGSRFGNAQAPRQFPSSQQRPVIPGVGQPNTCAAQGYSCPAGYACNPVNQPYRSGGRAHGTVYYECIPQSCGADGCMVGYTRVNTGDGNYSCRYSLPRGACNNNTASWGPRDAGPGIVCWNAF